MTKACNYLGWRRENMGGDPNLVLDELLRFAKQIMLEKQMYPYVALVVKNGVIISRGYNFERESKDLSMFSGVTAIRWAQDALDTGDLTGYSLYSLFQPTHLDFDVALWSGIRNFIWCIESKSLPKHFSDITYTPYDYLKDNPGQITIEGGIREEEAIALVREADEKNYFPKGIIDL
jgi:tRNA(Arg) A34 adenosine deaminase TadA